VHLHYSRPLPGDERNYLKRFPARASNPHGTFACRCANETLVNEFDRQLDGVVECGINISEFATIEITIVARAVNDIEKVCRHLPRP